MTLQDNIDWAKQFNDKIDTTLGNDRLASVFADQNELFDQLMRMLVYVEDFSKDNPAPSSIDVSRAHRDLYLSLTKSFTPLQSIVIDDYLVFLLEAKKRMCECNSFIEHCINLNKSDLIPHQFTQRVLTFAAMLSCEKFSQ